MNCRPTRRLCRSFLAALPPALMMLFACIGAGAFTGGPISNEQALWLAKVGGVVALVTFCVITILDFRQQE